MIRLFGTKIKETQGKETAHRLLAFAAFQTWGWTELPPMERGERGKPFFPGHTDRHFNLSHTAGFALCVLSDEGEVGVDIERVKERKEHLPRYVMTEEELACWDGTWEDFFRVWTLKEAYAKYRGGSIIPPRAVPTHPPVPHRSYEGENWRAALCGEGELPEEIEWIEL